LVLIVLKENGIGKVDGILLDLGVSSHQIDTDRRGFSYTLEAPLDMRMNPDDEIGAAGLLENIDEDSLESILRDYGEIGNPRRMVAALLKGEKRPATTLEIIQSLQDEYGPNLKKKVLSKLFQALRIAVNEELEVLELGLNQAAELLFISPRTVETHLNNIKQKLHCRDKAALIKKLLAQGIIVRDMAVWGLVNCIRVTVGRPAENKRFTRALKKSLV